MDIQNIQNIPNNQNIEIVNQNIIKQANETNEAIHSCSGERLEETVAGFPLADAVYRDVRADRDYGNGGR